MDLRQCPSLAACLVLLQDTLPEGAVQEASEPLSACPCLSRASQSMSMQHMLPTVQRNGAAYSIPALNCKEQGNRAVPPFQPLYHIMREPDEQEPLELPVQWREEESRINHGEDSPQRFQPTRIPWDGNWHKPQHRGAAWIHHHHQARRCRQRRIVVHEAASVATSACNCASASAAEARPRKCCSNPCRLSSRCTFPRERTAGSLIWTPSCPHARRRRAIGHREGVLHSCRYSANSRSV